MGLVGDISKLRQLQQRLRDLPVTVAQKVADAVAPELTSTAQTDYAGGRTAYGDARPTGVHGNALTLDRSGITKATLRFVAIGTRVRVALGTRYARYLIGKYGILPSAALPAAWRKKIAEVAAAQIQRGLAG